MDDVNCRGTETRLADCAYDSNTRDCNHLEDVFITCRGMAMNNLIIDAKYVIF